MVGVDKYIMIHHVFGQTVIQNLHPEFLSHFWNQQEDSGMILASTQEI
jgi:hypothetical protein